MTDKSKWPLRVMMLTSMDDDGNGPYVEIACSHDKDKRQVEYISMAEHQHLLAEVWREVAKDMHAIGQVSLADAYLAQAVRTQGEEKE